MLQWACASIGAILVTVNPAYRVEELVRCLNLKVSTRLGVLTYFLQIETIRVVGVSHLFLVPQIRTSSYLTLLAEALPSLRTFSPGDIQEEALPDLRHVVVIDNTHQPKKFHEMLGDIHCAVDFREVLLWQEGGAKETRLVEEAKKTLDKDDVINLQFTRSFLLSRNGRSLHAEFNLKWDDRISKGCLRAFCCRQLIVSINEYW
jgi:acyl-CoA synthetase (AMP-forming)/AMP-acid ligase II